MQKSLKPRHGIIHPALADNRVKIDVNAAVAGADLAEGADPANLIQLVTVHNGGSVARVGSVNTGSTSPEK